MRHDRGSLRTALAVLVVVLVALGTQAAQGSQGFSVSMPTPPKKPVAGLTLTLDCTWSEGGGYLPIRVTINCIPPATVDRRLTLEMSNRRWGEQRPVTVTKDVDIPAGASSVREVIPFPRGTRSYSLLSLSVWESAVFLRDLSFEGRGIMTTGIGQSQGPATLFVGSATLDISQLDFLINGGAGYGQGTVYATPTVTPGSQPAAIPIALIAPFVALPASELFEDWINYSGLDVIIIALSDIETLAATRPAVVEALRKWTLAGGNLCVFGVGDNWKGLVALEQRLQLPGEPSDPDMLPDGWNKGDPQIYKLQLQQPGNATVVRDESDLDAKPLKGKSESNPESSFVWRKAGLGVVAAITDANPFPGDRLEWRWLFNSIGADRWLWERRHGFSVDEGTWDFDRFVIDDVGLPPIRSYRVLITLFVLGIGPLNYWLLRRKGRLHLLLFTVPAAALTVSMALVGYAVIADGFDTYLRARSYTELDQARDEAVSWARLSYYAGVAPSNGLEFPVDMAVLPVERDRYRDQSTHALRQVDWNRAQHLVRGWVPSRTPAQYLTVRPYACSRELRVLETPAKGGCAVENRLETNVKFLMLRSAAGDLYFGRDIDRGGRAVLELLDTEETVRQATTKMLAERGTNALTSPQSAPTPVASLFFGNGVQYRPPRGPGYYSSTGLLETGLAGAFDQIGSQLPKPRTYVAIVERPADILVGVDDLVERQSLHVIFGTW